MYNKKCVMGFTLSILSIVLFFINILGLIGIYAWWLSNSGYKEVLVSGEKGDALAIAGVTIGSMSIILGILQFIFIAFKWLILK